jgi:hypothetical protein
MYGILLDVLEGIVVTVFQMKFEIISRMKYACMNAQDPNVVIGDGCTMNYELWRIVSVDV